MRLQVISQSKTTVRKDKAIVRVDNFKTNKTTIIISKKNLNRLKSHGKYGESIDDIANRIVDFDIDQSLKVNKNK